MTQFLFANNATSYLAAPVTSSQTTLPLKAGTGSLFPSPGAGQQFTVTLQDAATGLITEICYCLNVTGDTLTVTRGEEGTTAQAWNAHDLVSNLFTAGTAQSFEQAGTGGQFVEITPPALPAGATDNWNPALYVPGTTNQINLSGDPSTSTLNGLVSPGQNGFECGLFNAGAYPVKLAHEAGTSAPGNQFYVPGGLGPITLAPGAGVTIKWLSSIISGVSYWTFQ